MKIAVHTPLGGVSGYGRDGEGLTSALARSGHDVCVFPNAVVPPVAPDAAMLLTKHPHPPFDLTIMHVWPGAMTPNAGRRMVTSRLVGWTMWEQIDPDPEWVADFTAATAEMDLLLVYDEISHAALEPLARCPVERLQGGYDPTAYVPVERAWDTTFRFGMMGDLGNRRKDPFTSIKAFDLLKKRHGEDFDAELVLKSSTKGLPSKMVEVYPWLTIHVGLWPEERVQEFYGSLHCLVAPSRGEGKNVPALEAMSTGIPVIASDVGGHKEWMHPSIGWSVPAHDQPFEGRKWARVDVEELAEVMWAVYSDRAEVRRRGESARRTVPAMCSWASVAHRVIDKASTIAPRAVKGSW